MATEHGPVHVVDPLPVHLPSPIAAVVRPLSRMLVRISAGRCSLCGAAAQADAGLCARCRADLPRNHCCCGRCALPLARSAAACGRCQRHPPPWQQAWAPFRYGWPLDRLLTGFKFGADLAGGRALAMAWCAQVPPSRPALLLPVPLHRRRLRQRGYNQALELARPLAAAHGLALRCDLLQRVRPTAAQSELGAAARRANVRHAFALAEGAHLPPHVALVDDVLTTGATLAACTRVLHRAGVRRVEAWALARAPRPRR